MEEITIFIGRKNYKTRLICGDFNLNLLNLDIDVDTSLFLNLLASHAYLPLITRPTRVGNNTFTLIDNIFSQDSTNISSGIIPCDLSDHYPIFIVHKNFFSSPIPNCNKSVKYRLLNDDTIGRLCNCLLYTSPSPRDKRQSRMPSSA